MGWRWMSDGGGGPTWATSRALSRGGGAETQGVLELAAGTRVYPEPEDC